jgi:multidrug efflux pump subunit AcrA (membrane-fusion protein)
VSYDVQINFDTQDARVKPGMTINADIQTGVVQDALAVPSSAVKTLNGESYVQVFIPPLADTGGNTGVTSDTPPQMVPVTIGLSDDSNVQILSGLEAGQQIVVSTRTTAQKTTTAATSARTTPGAAGAANRGFGGGGAIRIGG